MTTPIVPKQRSAAWRRTMESAREQAIEMLERIGPNADHLPDEPRKAQHRKLTADLERIVQVVDQHLRDAQAGKRLRTARRAASS